MDIKINGYTIHIGRIYIQHPQLEWCNKVTNYGKQHHWGAATAAAITKKFIIF